MFVWGIRQNENQGEVSKSRRQLVHAKVELGGVEYVKTEKKESERVNEKDRSDI